MMDGVYKVVNGIDKIFYYILKIYAQSNNCIYIATK